MVMGDHLIPADWAEGERYRRPIAWSSTDGSSFAQEEIPLPTWGIDGFEHDTRGDLDPETPMDFSDLELGSSVVAADDASISLAVYFADDCRTARRGADGAWSISDVDAYSPERIFSCVADEEGTIARTEACVYVKKRDDPSYTAGLAYAPTRELQLSAGSSADGIVAMSTWDTGYLRRDDRRIAWGDREGRLPVGVEGDEVVRPHDPDVGLQDPSEAYIHHLGGGITLYTGVPPSSDDAASLYVRVSTDGTTWQEPTGIEIPEGNVEIGDAVSVDGIHYFPLSSWVPRDGSASKIEPVVYRSEDGLTWERVGAFDAAFPVPDLAANGARVQFVTVVDGQIIGVGTSYDASDAQRLCTFLLQGQSWTPIPVDGAPAGSTFYGSSVVAGNAMVRSRWGSRWSVATVAADGSISENYRSTDIEDRGLPLDLGGGAMLSGGWIDRPAAENEKAPEVGVGACVWASLDAGETWNATMLPAEEGRYPDVSLIPDGEDVLVLLEDPDIPRGYRIVGARADVLGENE
ncbi:hypothetical protein ACFQRD_10570 [Brachybacterium sp. GCM10030268]|uniref:hypothetical protein n=2 Tax=unclassified Brachybacterium TaxID=2623841 RepID=UPI00360C0354